MKDKNYIIKYSPTFMSQFSNILNYFVHKLKNKIAAENFYNEVIQEIEKRSENPTIYEKYIGLKRRKDVYYKIYVKNYTIFYVVKNNTMEIRRILYSRRNFKELV